MPSSFLILVAGGVWLGAAASGSLEAQELGLWERAVPVAERPPKIDGRLDEGEWQGAAIIDDLRQVEPVEGVEPSERTVIYLLVGRDHLYVALRCFDTDPGGVVASQVTRDAQLDPDDRVELILDTFLDRRNAYFFQIGPGGSKGDALIANNGGFFSKDWDGIWEGRAIVDEEGWSAELAIPAKSLSLKPGSARWGFNARRYIKRKNEVLQWAHPSRRTPMFNVSSAGTLSGLQVLDRGRGLDLVPYVSLQGSRDPRDGASGSELEPGFDLRYRVTPGLTATLTVNTDFAQTEVDGRVVNLSRFPVFFPEKRDFFLEDSGIFTFGPFDGRRRREVLPFFSRRIGLSGDGARVPILAGLKLAGRVGRWNLGLLDVATDDLGTLDRQNLGVARLSRNLLAESQLGATLTAGDPDSNGDNTLAALDFTYRTRRLRGRDVFRLDAWAAATESRPESGEERGGHAFGILAQYPNDNVEAELGAYEISASFEPALGFVQRRGVRRLFGRLELQPRPRRGPVRRLGFGVDPSVFLSLADDDVETASYGVKLIEVVLHSGDSLEVEIEPTEERLVEPFEIRDGVVLAPGAYRFDRWSVEVEAADKRPVWGSLSLAGGTFFDGRRDEIEGELSFRLGRGLTVSAEVEHNDVRLPAGDFTANLASLRTTVDFSPEVSWVSFVQWDDESDSIGVNSRVRWILEPGRDLFFVVNQSFERDDELGARRGFRTASGDATVKASYTLRF